MPKKSNFSERAERIGKKYELTAEAVEEIKRLSKDSYIQGSNSCHAIMKQQEREASGRHVRKGGRG